MAKKKKAKKKATQPSVIEKVKLPDPPAPKTYDILYAARQEMNGAHADVLQAELEVNSAYANQGDFAARDRNTEEARIKLNEARSRASAASTNFQVLKMEARKKK